MVPTIALRMIKDSDLDAIFEFLRDPESVYMAGFTAEDPNDRTAFDSHMARVIESSDTTNRAIMSDNRVVGTIAAFPLEGVMEVTYWIDQSFWGRGIASRALELLLYEVSVRPIRARVASDNIRSLRVLQRFGFKAIGTEVSYAAARGAVIEEMILEYS